MQMRAMIFTRPGAPLRLEARPIPLPGPGQLLLHVHACGICRTDLHILDGELNNPRLSLIPGHQIVGRVAALGSDIYMSGIPSFSYDLLWGERALRSVANFTRRDAEEFLDLAPRVPVRTT